MCGDDAARVILGGVAKMISQRDLRNSIGEILSALGRGESFVLTRDGRPVGELRPLPRHVSRETLLEAFRDAPPIDGARFRRDLDVGLDSHSV